MVDAFDAAGFAWILIETVGAGQAEVEIARTAHTTVVVEAPGLGDEVQAIKAGILEIADVLVVNKADLPGADNAVRALQSALELAANLRPVWDHHGRLETVEAASAGAAWTPPILKTVATQGEGIVELADALRRMAPTCRPAVVGSGATASGWKAKCWRCSGRICWSCSWSSRIGARSTPPSRPS